MQPIQFLTKNCSWVMILSDGWRFEEMGDTVTESIHSISPTGDTIYLMKKESLIAVTKSFQQILPFPSDEIRAMLDIGGGIILLGTEMGNMIVMKDFENHSTHHIYDSAIVNIKDFGPDILVQMKDSYVCIIEKDSVLGDLRMSKWKIPYPVNDAVIIRKGKSSVLNPPKSLPPYIVSTSDAPFIGFSSIHPSQSTKTGELLKPATRLIKSAFRWITGEDDIIQPEEIPKAGRCGKIVDEGRCGKTIIASPDERFIAVNDNFNRVVVIDTVYWHIIKVIKGMRDSQMGWDGRTLLIFSPFRSTILAFDVSKGACVDACKVDKSGVLLSNANGCYLVLNDTVNRIHYEPTEEQPIKPEPFTSTPIPEFIANEMNPVISKIKRGEHISIDELETQSLAATAIKVLLSYSLLEKDFLNSVVEKFNIKEIDRKESTEFFLCCDRTSVVLEPEFQLRRFYTLFNLFDGNSETIMNPMETTAIFDLIVRDSASDVFLAYELSNCDLSTFMTKFIEWISTHESLSELTPLLTECFSQPRFKGMFISVIDSDPSFNMEEIFTLLSD